MFRQPTLFACESFSSDVHVLVERQHPLNEFYFLLLTRCTGRVLLCSPLGRFRVLHVFAFNVRSTHVMLVSTLPTGKKQNMFWNYIVRFPAVKVGKAEEELGTRRI